MRQSIRRRMIILIVLPTFLIFAAVATGALLLLQRVEERHMRARMVEQATGYARHFDLLLRETAAVADTAARLLEIQPRADEEQIFALLESNVRSHAFAYGSACAFEPAPTPPPPDVATPGRPRLYCPYVYRSGDDLARMNIDESVYDWLNDPQWQWFRRPRELGHGVWSDPYFDEGAGNALMTTYSAPFFDGGRFRGVVTIDILLPELQQTLGRDIDPGLKYVIVTEQGQFVYTPEVRRIMSQSIFQYADEVGRPELAEAARMALTGQAGVSEIDGWDEPDRQLVFYASIPSTRWTVISRLSRRVALQDARARATLLAGLLALTLLLIVIAVYFVSGRITRPIRRLREGVLRIAGGDLEARVGEVAGGDEVAELARSFDKMAGDLRGHIDAIADERAARRTMENELTLAREIQVQLLPKGTPDIPGYDVAGWNSPATQTAGDYYDWQPLPGGRYVFTIADVCGHGVGPALVTAVCRAYMRAGLQAGSELAALMTSINALLQEDLPSNRFVTFAAAVLDPGRGEMMLLSAGHGPLYFLDASVPRVESFDAHGLPLAVLPQTVYGPAQLLVMKPGDALCLVTDGFAEWQRGDGKMFGAERLMDALRESGRGSAMEIIEALHTTAAAFAAPAKQQDDLTAVVVKRNGP